MDCFTKTVAIQGIGDKRVVVKGEQKDIASCVILVLVARKLLRKGCCKPREKIKVAWIAN